MAHPSGPQSSPSAAHTSRKTGSAGSAWCAPPCISPANQHRAELLLRAVRSWHVAAPALPLASCHLQISTRRLFHVGRRTCKPSPCSTGMVVYLAMRASISAISLFSRRRYQEPELVRTLHVQNHFVPKQGPRLAATACCSAGQVRSYLLGMLWPVVLSTTVDFTWCGFACTSSLPSQ